MELSDEEELRAIDNQFFSDDSDNNNYNSNTNSNNNTNNSGFLFPIASKPTTRRSLTSSNEVISDNNNNNNNNNNRNTHGGKPLPPNVRDIDERDQDDPNYCTQYIHEIYAHLRKSEVRAIPLILSPNDRSIPISNIHIHIIPILFPN